LMFGIQRRDGRSPYAAWFDRLNAQARQSGDALTRLAGGNFSNVKESVPACSNAGSTLAPDTRVFRKRRRTPGDFACGGTKKRQQHDINALLPTGRYKRRK